AGWGGGGGGAAPPPAAVFGLEKGQTHSPVISVLVPVCDPDGRFFRELIESVLAQTYGNWELILADAGMTQEAKEIALSYSDPRIRYHRLEKNGGISENTNAAAAFAQGDYVAFLDHDDLLTPDALFEAAGEIVRTGAEILYTDEDKCDASGARFFEPNRKPDFNLDYFQANNYICHFLLMKRELFLALGLRSAYDGAQDYDLMLRAPKSEIAHIGRVLYHWRTHSRSTAGNPGSKDYAYEAGKAALEDHFRECRIQAQVTHSRHRGFYDVTYLPDIFTARKDVGVLGGKLINGRRRIVGGLYDEEGNALFLGMHEQESGPMHRADTMQDAAAVDVRCMQIRPELYSLYESVFGVSYDTHVMQSGAGLKELSVIFCRSARSLGYRVVWDPRIVRMIR
ncbi:MAG: glycosyltransferase, partial [Eubacteriales bacterium]|nr:glycosyltransferase [Eubacteriales bacterium]